MVAVPLSPFPNYNPNTTKTTTASTYNPATNPAQFQNVNATTQPSADPFSNLTSLFNSAVASPYNAQQVGQYDSLQNQLALLMGGYTNQSSLLNQQAGFDTRNLNLTGQQYGIQAGALNRQSSLLPQLNTIAQQQYDLQTQGANESAAASRRASDSAATASGAYTSIGHNQQLTDIQSQLQRSLSNIALQRQQHALSYDEQLASLGDSQKQLGIMEQRLGISREEITTRLNNALNQLGLSSAMSVNDMLGELGKIESGDYSPISQLAGDIYAISGIPLGGPDTTGKQTSGAH